MAEEKKIVYTVEVKADDAGLRKVDKATSNTSKNLKKINKDGKDSGGMFSKLSGAAGKAGVSTSGFGGAIGKLPGLFKMAGGMAKSFFAILTANPIGLILAAIAIVIAVIIAALTKFKPITEWISDQISGISAMIDTFVNSITAVGEIIKDVFEGKFSEASKKAKELGKAILDARDAHIAFIEAQREYKIQSAENNATTARELVNMKKWEAAMRDNTIAVKDRLDATKNYYKELGSEAQADYDTQKNLNDTADTDFRDQHKTEIDAWVLKHGKVLESIEDYASLASSSAQVRDDALKMINMQQTLYEDAGKIAEATAQKEKQLNRIKLQGLTYALKVIKSQTKYYEAAHQSILKGEKHFNKEMVDAEEERLKKIETKQIAAARKQYEIIKASSKNPDVLKAAWADYQTAKINIQTKTNNQIKKNDDTLFKHQIQTLDEALNLFKAQHAEELKDTIITSKKELEERKAIWKQTTDKQKDVIREKAKAEEWSADKLKTKLLLIDNSYVEKVKQLNKSLEDNNKKTEKARLKDKEKVTKLLENIEKARLKDKEKVTKLLENIEKEYSKNRILTLNQSYNNDLTNIKNNLHNKQLKLHDAYTKKLLSDEEYQKASTEITATYEAEKQEIEDAHLKAQIAKINKNLQKASQISSEFIAINNAVLDGKLRKIEVAASKEDKLEKTKYENSKARLKADLKNHLISKASFTKQITQLDKDYNTDAKKRADDKAKAEYNAKKKAFEDNKKFQEASIVMNAASAIIGTWAGYSKMGVPGVILAGIQTAMIATLAAVQIANVASAEFTGATGGIIPGDQHANASGGVQLTPRVLAEGGEFLVNQASTKKFEPLLSAINNTGNAYGDSSSVSDNLIDYNKLALAMQSKKVYVVSHDITEQQSEDTQIKERVEF